jgi:peptidoglycan/xylan/chitin deacetylase (PgdA/CDA1 family)
MNFNKHLLQAAILFLSVFSIEETAAQNYKPEIPVLCYHQIRNWQTTDSKFSRIYIMPTDNFSRQMQLLADSGYHTIRPDQLLNYLNNDASLPSKPVLITFDDGTASQFMSAVPVLKQHHFIAVFFIMTVH